MKGAVYQPLTGPTETQLRGDQPLRLARRAHGEAEGAVGAPARLVLRDREALRGTVVHRLRVGVAAGVARVVDQRLRLLLAHVHVEAHAVGVRLGVGDAGVLQLRHRHRHRLHVHEHLLRDVHAVVNDAHVIVARGHPHLLVQIQVLRRHTRDAEHDLEATRRLYVRLARHAQVVHRTHVEAALFTVHAPLTQRRAAHLRRLLDVPLAVVEGLARRPSMRVPSVRGPPSARCSARSAYECRCTRPSRTPAPAGR